MVLNSNNDVHRLLEFLNSISLAIQFTLELMCNNSLAFLDLVIHLSPSNGLSTSVFRKSTNTDAFLAYESCAPKKYKVSVIRSLIHRAISHSSNWQAFNAEIEYITKMLTKNGYPRSLIVKVTGDFLNSFFDSVGKRGGEKPEFSMYLPLEYRGVISLSFAARIRRLVPNCHVYFKTRKLRSCLTDYKIGLAVEKEFTYKSFVIYKYSCTKCHSNYIGFSSRHLIKRISEHAKGDLFSHHLSCNNSVNFSDAFTILSQSDNYVKTHIIESIFINHLKPTLNTQLQVS